MGNANHTLYSTQRLLVSVIPTYYEYFIYFTMNKICIILLQPINPRIVPLILWHFGSVKFQHTQIHIHVYYTRIWSHVKRHVICMHRPLETHPVTRIRLFGLLFKYILHLCIRSKIHFLLWKFSKLILWKCIKIHVAIMWRRIIIYICAFFFWYSVSFALSPFVIPLV